MLWPFEFLESFRCSISNVSICDAPESDIRVKRLWPFEFLESFRCSISNVSICDAPQSDFRGKSYDHWNFSRASVVQFLPSWYILRLNRTSICLKLWPFEFLVSFVVQFQASRYIMCLNLTCVWNVMTIWMSRELPLFYFEHLDMWCAWIDVRVKSYAIWISGELRLFKF